MGFVVTFVSPSNPTAQVSLMRDDSPAVLPQMSIEVTDVDDVHSRAVSRGPNIVYPLTNEPWGVRRFFVIDPSGTIINVMCHIGELSAEGCYHIRSELHKIVIASVAPFNKARRILGPPHEHASD
jgi:hypothetical protein